MKNLNRYKFSESRKLKRKLSSDKLISAGWKQDKNSRLWSNPYLSMWNYSKWNALNIEILETYDPNPPKT